MQLTLAEIRSFTENKYWFHNDQKMLPISNGVVVVATVEVSDNERYREAPINIARIESAGEKQRAIITHLKEKGFTVHEIVHSAKNITDNSFALNSVIFKRDGVKHAWIPIYGTDIEINESNRNLPVEQLVKSGTPADQLTKLLNSLGYKVSGCLDQGAFAGKGSLHCKLNVHS